MHPLHPKDPTDPMDLWILWIRWTDDPSHPTAPPHLLEELTKPSRRHGLETVDVDVRVRVRVRVRFRVRARVRVRVEEQRLQEACRASVLREGRRETEVDGDAKVGAAGADYLRRWGA